MLVINCFTAKAEAGGFRFSPLHSRAALRSAALSSISFIVSPSLGYLLKSASIHSITLIPTRRFIPLPPWLSPLAIRNSKPKREAPFHPTPLSILHSVTTLVFPTPISSMPLRYSLPRKIKTYEIPHRPLMVQVKI